MFEKETKRGKKMRQEVGDMRGSEKEVQIKLGGLDQIGKLANTGEKWGEQTMRSMQVC